MNDMALFTGVYTNPLAFSPHTTMQAAIDTTQAALSLAGSPNVNSLAMTVVMITGSEGTFDHPWAGLRVHETHYAASMIKIAAMYAAFDMRSSADTLVSDLGLTAWPDMEAALVASFNPEVDAHNPAQITGSPLLRPEDRSRKPNYAAMLQPGRGGVFAVDFTAAQLAAFEDFVVQQHNPGAGTTIHNLGYPYLNGKIADDGFFDGTDGLWLAGDYVHTWPAARIACVNDVDTAQGTTTFQFASLMTLLANEVLVGPTSSLEMKALMGRAGTFYSQTVPPLWPAGGRFRATHGKVGIGPLKSGKTVFSEAIIAVDTFRGLEFVAVWANVVQNGQTQRQLFEPVALLTEAAVTAFVP
jgi:hypothetical protein